MLLHVWRGCLLHVKRLEICRCVETITSRIVPLGNHENYPRVEFSGRSLVISVETKVRGRNMAVQGKPAATCSIIISTR